MTSLNDQLSAIKAAAAGRLPGEVAGTFTNQQARLKALPAPVVPTGRELPDAALLTVTGATTTLRELLDGGPGVLVFYRGGWCPYCNLTLRVYQAELLPRLQELGARLVAVSPQLPDGSLSAKEKAELTFDVVSDPGNDLAGTLGIVDDGSEEVRAAQAALGLDLAELNEGGDVRLPMPAVVVVDAARRAQWADVHPDYTTRTEVADVVDAVQRLK
ncbi:MAG TPA: peroxiredoxin-like family protein [Acidimicrobiales bacterium]|nr:peroxiredoxin-like family protein [Acidimicrobiales bacterium]